MSALLWFVLGVVSGALLVIVLSALSINKDMERY
jgi:hypothetical protein